MKKLTLVLFAIFCFVGHSQKLEQYTASNGITYKPGDKITLKRGSAPDGSFLYVERGGSVSWGVGVPERLDRTHTGMTLKIKKIMRYQTEVGRVALIATIGLGIKYRIYIEDAIATCEVGDCIDKNKSTPTSAPVSKYDELKKLKELLDTGIITEEEFEQEKAEILNE